MVLFRVSDILTGFDSALLCDPFNTCPILWCILLQIEIVSVYFFLVYLMRSFLVYYLVCLLQVHVLMSLLVLSKI